MKWINNHAAVIKRNRMVCFHGNQSESFICENNGKYICSICKGEFTKDKAINFIDFIKNNKIEYTEDIPYPLILKRESKISDWHIDRVLDMSKVQEIENIGHLL